MPGLYKNFPNAALSTLFTQMSFVGIKFGFIRLEHTRRIRRSMFCQKKEEYSKNGTKIPTIKHISPFYF